MINEKHTLTTSLGTIHYLTPNEFLEQRAKNSLVSEPETICWLNQMKKNDVLFDIGANVGNFSLYSAKLREVTTYAFEPESTNFNILTKNIRVNRCENKLTAYPIAIGTADKFNTLYLDRELDGWACNSVGANLDPYLNLRAKVIQQGTICYSLDKIVKELNVIPTHIKIDVDGLELEVLKSGENTLSNDSLKSILVELNPAVKEHRQAISLLQSHGFFLDEELVEKSTIHNGHFKGMCNFIFHRCKNTLQIIKNDFLAQQPDVFDNTVKSKLNNESIIELCDYILDTLLTKPVLVHKKKHSIKRLLHSNPLLFNRIYKLLDVSNYDDFTVVENIGLKFNNNEKQELKRVHEDRLKGKKVNFCAIEGRYRAFISPNELTTWEDKYVSKIHLEVEKTIGKCAVEKVLFETISTVDIPELNIHYWHIDSLTDQLKVVVPLESIGKHNAPMKIIKHLKDDQLKVIEEHMHLIYKVGGIHVSNANYFRESLFDQTTQVHTLEIDAFQVFAFNPKVIHTGSTCRQNERKTITVYFRLRSQRNHTLAALD